MIDPDTGAVDLEVGYTLVGNRSSHQLIWNVVDDEGNILFELWLPGQNTISHISNHVDYERSSYSLGDNDAQCLTYNYTCTMILTDGGNLLAPAPYHITWNAAYSWVDGITTITLSNDVH
jgi:hypothetical protein